MIIMTHEPNWLLDWYFDHVTGKNVTYLIRDHLKGRCRLRIAGDVHHYMRHSYVPANKPVHVQHLLVNGCGGAFLHPTHVFKNFKETDGTSYETKASYPTFEDSTRVWNLKYPFAGFQSDTYQKSKFLVGYIIQALTCLLTFADCIGQYIEI